MADLEQRGDQTLCAYVQLCFLAALGDYIIVPIKILQDNCATILRQPLLCGCRMKQRKAASYLRLDRSGSMVDDSVR